MRADRTGVRLQLLVPRLRHLQQGHARGSCCRVRPRGELVPEDLRLKADLAISYAAAGKKTRRRRSSRSSRRKHDGDMCHRMHWPWPIWRLATWTAPWRIAGRDVQQEERAPWLIFMNENPRYDGLRGDPRFGRCCGRSASTGSADRRGRCPCGQAWRTLATSDRARWCDANPRSLGVASAALSSGAARCQPGPGPRARTLRGRAKAIDDATAQSLGSRRGGAQRLADDPEHDHRGDGGVGRTSTRSWSICSTA